MGVDPVVLNIVVAIFLLFIFSILYYTICRFPGNWVDINTELSYFECLYIALGRIVTTGTGKYNENSFQAMLITFFLDLVVLISIVELLSLLFINREKRSV